MINNTLWLIDVMLWSVLVGHTLSGWRVAAALVAPSFIAYWLSSVGALGNYPVEVAYALAFVSPIGIAGAAWVQTCNSRTLRDKLAMAAFLYNNTSAIDDGSWWSLAEADADVNYHRHLNEYVRGRKPMRLYPRLLQLAVARAPRLKWWQLFWYRPQPIISKVEMEAAEERMRDVERLRGMKDGP